MRNLKWLYACSLAIAFGVLSFVTVSCHDDDDEPKQEPGEVIETPAPVVEYYIMVPAPVSPVRTFSPG